MNPYVLRSNELLQQRSPANQAIQSIYLFPDMEVAELNFLLNQH